MRDRGGCKRILLSGHSGFRVHFCETHRTIELEIGVMSLRLDEDALALLSQTLQESVRNLQGLDNSDERFEAFMRQLKSS
ncbi:hypothetical protein [Methylophilus aquaticus]|uniref:Uncharacterized protein n=1 Tax=Methylophilus aquaticus TaxID=1971610 RepID=A0ABT9JS91_9PROT|nr:hypothetical protein [Methylophilus aquaticus]MDP8567395.1 hypothetical protein [Methylophilus aquaticus]